MASGTTRSDPELHECNSQHRICFLVGPKRLAPVMAELVPTLRRFTELDISDELAELLVVMSPATMDLGSRRRRPR